MNTQPSIAIVGAGLGGLACARVLQHFGRAVTIYEREPSPESRSQGGTLDLHADTGQVALAAAGLLEAFLAIARPEGQEMRSLDHNGTVLREFRPEEGDTFKPEIDRGQLRALYLNALQPGTIHWGQSLREVIPGTRPTLVFANGRKETHDLVIGADGAWSKVRPAISAAIPEYTGVAFAETGFDDVDTSHPEVAALTGEGMMVAKGNDLALFAQRNSGSRIRIYLAFHDAPNWAQRQGIDFADPEAARTHLLNRYASWSPHLRALIADSKPEFIDRPLYALPVPHTWSHTPGITLLGDAAHLMPPLGLGANLAMLDGAELAQAILSHDTVDEAVRDYESIMLPRSIEAAEACGEGLRTMLPEPVAVS